MKRIAAVILSLCLLLTAVPVLADGAFEYLNQVIGTTGIAGVSALGSSIDVAGSVNEVEGSTVLLINLSSNFISISGRNGLNQYTCPMWINLSFSQVAAYGAALLEQYDLIDGMRTTATTFGVIVTYGEEDDDMIIVLDQEQATAIADILKN